ncbi:hypothetical protein KHQ88_05660 [Mycoplasmatota bacterium]|nr:hypothetical protein KHQ88_05660 [Mycoplasmatota bacterium]
MKNGTAKKYYKKINRPIEKVNKADDFAKHFLKLLDTSDLEFYQKERKEKRIFDDSWMSEVEDIIPVIDKLTRNPREALKKIREVVPVERAKKIDADSIRHLASHSELIKSADRHGNIVPSKVLTSYYDQDLGTYENRFLASLVDKLYMFIELRYQLIVDKMNTEYINYMKINSKLNWENTKIDYDISLRINKDIDDDEMGRKNQELLERMTEARKSISKFKMSNFMSLMAQFTPVRSPIMITNVIRKNVDFAKCYHMWTLLDQVDRIGYEADILDRDIALEDKYETQVKNALMVLYTTVANSQLDDFNIDLNKPFNHMRSKKVKSIERIEQDQYLEAGQYIHDDHRLNQYFLDKIRDTNDEKFKTMYDADIPDEESIKLIYTQLQKITDAAFRDFIAHKYNLENVSDVQEKIEIQKKILSTYKEIEQLKKDNLKDFKINKTLASLNLDKFKKEWQDIKDEEKEKQRLIEEEKRKERLAELDKEARDKIIKQEKLEEAKRILAEAEKLRKKQKNK